MDKKKVLAILLVLMIAVSLAACGGADEPTDEGTDNMPFIRWLWNLPSRPLIL
jgi:ABC-type glycerol-3-phosphate transport system substrate-binding protein